jgi:hypothetical protein
MGTQTNKDFRKKTLLVSQKHHQGQTALKLLCFDLTKKEER